MKCTVLAWAFPLAVYLQLLSRVNPTSAASSCISTKVAEECRSEVDQSTGEQCVWCECKAVPAECLPASLAKKLPKAVFTCDDVSEIEDQNSPATVKIDLHKDMSYKDDHKVEWLDYEEWGEKYLSPAYSTAQEYAERLGIFALNVEEVAVHNTRGDRPYELGLNQFSAMSWEEFRSTRLGFGGSLSEDQNCSATHTRGQYRAVAGKEVRSPPATRDWRDEGAVSVVKDQSHCGSCWTFSTTGCLESHHYLSTGDMVLLSEQQLVDCAGAYDNHGCSGGLPSHAFEYIAAAGGLDTEEAYSYKAEESDACYFESEGVGAQVLRSVNITFQDEDELLEAVGNTGPVSVAFQVASDFKAYSGGVYDNPDCSKLPEEVNHAVLAVGYDTTDDGIDYWIIKNSWGSDWGLDGYFHMVRGKNMCGIADCASFPSVP